jgi:hypothetical protein
MFTRRHRISVRKKRAEGSIRTKKPRFQREFEEFAENMF